MSEDHNENTQTQFITVEQFEAGLLRQEHRVFRVLYNYFIARPSWPKDDVRRNAAFEALLFVIAQALMPAAAIAGTGLVGVAGLLLTFHANKILETQTTLLERQNALVETQTQFIEQQSRQAEYQTALADAARRAGSSHELANVLSEIASEVAKTSKSSPSPDAENVDETPLIQLPASLYSRIVALSRMLRPYRFLDSGGKLIDKPLSPERGQLLIVLAGADVDLRPLAQTADFSYADLEDATLIGKDLSRMKLSNANFRKANLSYADLSGANIRSCDFSHANLCGADLSFYTTKSGSFVTITDSANFDGAILEYAYLLAVPSQLWKRGMLLEDAIVSKTTELTEDWTVVPMQAKDQITSYPVQFVKKAFREANELKLVDSVEDRLATLASISGVLSSNRKSTSMVREASGVGAATGIQSLRAIPLDIRKRCGIVWSHFPQEVVP